MSAHARHDPHGVTPVKCRTCNRPMNSPIFCMNCRTLYTDADVDYFSLLNLPAQYDIDLAELQRHYLQTAREVHPDRLGDSVVDPGVSMQASARLNEAKRVLRDPILRAGYLLELHGGKSSAEDKTVPQEVLNQTLLLREEIDEAREADDMGALAQLRAQVEVLQDKCVGRIQSLARQLPGDEAIRQDLRATLNAMRYYQKLMELL